MKDTLEMWMLAASNGFGSVFEVKAAAAVKCQRGDFSFHPLFQTGPALLPCVMCVALPWLHPLPGDSARVFTLPGLTSCRRAPFEIFGGVWELLLQPPTPCLILFQVSFCRWPTHFIFLLPSEMRDLTWSGVPVVSLFPWCLVLCLDNSDYVLSSFSSLLQFPSLGVPGQVAGKVGAVMWLVRFMDP